MFWCKRIFKISTIYLLCYFQTFTAIKYVFNPLQDDIFEKCSDVSTKFLDEIIDRQNFNIERINDTSLVIDGYMEFSKDINSPIQLRAGLKKKEHGSYVDTPFELSRQDFLKALFDPNEIFYSYSKQVKKLYSDGITHKAGEKIGWDNVVASLTAEVDNDDLEGDYLLTVILVADGIPYCGVAKGDLEKL